MRISQANDDPALYKVLVNPEAQYSIWPADRNPPAGWRDCGKSGPKDECLTYISQALNSPRPSRRPEPLDMLFGIPERDPEAGLGLPESGTGDGPERPGCPMGR